MKSIMQSSGSSTLLPPVTSNQIDLHKAQNFASVYGAILSDEGKHCLASWALTATEDQLEDVRISFTAIQSTFNPKSVTKDHFIPKEVEVDKGWNRKRIDWMSKKVHSHMQNTVQNPMAARKEQKMADDRVERFTKPKSQFDGNAVLKSMGLDGSDALEKLRYKREAAANAAVCTVDPSGCVVYKRQGQGENRIQESSRDRIVATFNASNTATWQTTTRDTIRDHSGSALAKTERVSSESHPSMSRVTASLGMVLPHPSLKPRH
eukprot:GDKJ01001677.1.p1 GENE.GDKJ01001677.1~~GDKJ01001677.1.p1  ORF type:complete len:290 (+),score=18.12 GDKJ01001677.1:79-870(+)